MLIGRKKKQLKKKPEVFDFDYIPPEDMVYIRDEMREAGGIITDFIFYGLRRNLILKGHSGSGKTLCARIIAREAEAVDELNVKSFFVKCSDATTSVRILEKILNKRLHGLSYADALDESFEVFTQHDRNIIILDEADFLTDFKLLHSLSRAGESFEYRKGKKPSVAIILIINSYETERLLHSHTATWSSLQPVIIPFGPYSEEEIFQILKMRAEEGLVEGCWDEECLKVISGETSVEAFSDVRVAIETLNIAVSLAERENMNRITPRLCARAFWKAKRYVWRFVISKLNIHQLVMLLAVARSEDKTSGKVFETYERLCRTMNISPLNYRSFHSHIQNLQSHGTVSTSIVRAGKGRTKEIELLVEGSVIEEELEKRERAERGIPRKITLDSFGDFT